MRRTGKTEEEYKLSCETFSYEDIARNPDKFVGKSAFFIGKVVQVTENGNKFAIRANVTCVTHDYWEDTWKDTVFIEYTKVAGESRILEGDIIAIYGDLNGLKTYTSTSGRQVSIPLVMTKYIEIYE